MLILVIPEEEYFNNEDQTFHSVPEFTLELEHSLVSLSKWESKWEKPFLGADPKTPEEIQGYIEAMILTPDYPKNIWERLGAQQLNQINDYIEAKQTATTFGDMPERKSRGEVITSELIYYWMVAFTIPFECETWHLNRLFALIRICNIKNSKSKNMSRSEIAERNRRLNAERRSKFNTSG